MNVRRLIYEILQPDDGHSMSSPLFNWLITALIMASVVIVFASTFDLPPGVMRSMSIFEGMAGMLMFSKIKLEEAIMKHLASCAVFAIGFSLAASAVEVTVDFSKNVGTLKRLNGIFKMKFLVAALSAFAAGVFAEAETFELKARASMTPVELNKGDICRFTLVNGQTRTIEYLGTESSVLEIPATEGLVATLTMRLMIDGAEIPFRRYFATQESFYEPAVVNGMTIFPDSTLEYLQKTVPMRYPAKGAMRHHPWKDCRIVVQDATLPLCPEKLHPWFLDCPHGDLSPAAHSCGI